MVKNGNGKKTELATVKSYAIVKAGGIESIGELIKENVGNEGITPWDLDRVKMPSGGGMSWELPTEGGMTPTVEFEGVIIHHQAARVYWESDMASGGGTPPNCSSNNGASGVGDPGGSCSNCPFAQFGTEAGGGRGQACKQIKRLFIMRQESLLPLMISLPPTSLSVVKKYMLRLTSYQRAYHSVITKFGLEKATSKDGIEYAKVVLTMAGPLSPEDSAIMKGLSESLKPYLESLQVSDEEYQRPTEPKSDMPVAEHD